MLAALAIGRTIIRSYYYVADYNGAVSIMQGIQVSILGVPLHQPYSQGCLNSRNQLSVIRYGQAGATLDCQLMKLSDLAESARAQVAAGLPAGTLDQANAQLRRLSTESLLPLCPLARAQSPSPSTPQPAPTTAQAPEPEPGAGKPRSLKSHRAARCRHRPRPLSQRSPRRHPGRACPDFLGSGVPRSQCSSL